MARTDVEREILKPMQATFYSVRDLPADELKAALNTYADVLQDFEAADLREGWKEVAAKWSKGGWPFPNMILLEVRKARNHRLPAARDISMSRYGLPSMTVLHRRWLDCRSTQLAYDAQAHQVSWSLKCRVLYGGVIPDEALLPQLIRQHASALGVRNEIERGDAIPWNGRFLTFTDDNRGSALRLWDILLQREAETKNEILKAWDTKGLEAVMTHQDPLDAYWTRERENPS